ncbi:MAG: hypothetical protein QM778_22010 [Myxococcales bacterium]
MVRAVRLNLGLCLLIATVVALLGSTIVAAMPVIYEATFKIFIQDGGNLTVSLASGRDRNRAIEGARGLEEFILARDNLLSIVREAQLVERWPSTRPLPMRLKDQLMGSIFGQPAARDLERGFVEMLGSSITGKKDGESIRVSAQWRDGPSAYEVARLVQRNFLAARASHDLGPIQRAIPFLEAQLQQADLAIESGVTRVLETSAKPAVSATAPKKPVSDPERDASLVELASLTRELAEIRREQRSLMEPYRKRLTELKTVVADLKIQYSEDHPLLQQAEARVEAASELPAEMASLKAKEADVLARLASKGVNKVSAGDAAEEELDAPVPVDTGDIELAPVKARLFNALRKSDEIAARLESARIELASAETDFNHRYVVIEQPEVPSRPLKGKKPVLFIAVLIASILFGVAGAGLREFRRGRLMEPWQVRAIGLPLLAEVELKKLPPPSK